jgi:hypothetical protein
MTTPTSSLPEKFDDISRKLGRGLEHAKAFNDAAQVFWKSEVYAGKPDVDRKGRGIYRVARIDPPPPELAMLIGESAHQLRSSLDHLMWLLAKPAKKEESKVQFPITSTYARYLGARWMMPGVPRGVRTLVERLQPYHSRRWPQTALLGQLREIANWDKHRTLITTAVAPVVTDPIFRIVGRATIKNVEVFRPVLKANAILIRWEVGDFEDGTTVYVKPITTIIPQFDKRLPKEIRGRPIFDTLNDCRLFIRNEVLPVFARFF